TPGLANPGAVGAVFRGSITRRRAKKLGMGVASLLPRSNRFLLKRKSGRSASAFCAFLEFRDFAGFAGEGLRSCSYLTRREAGRPDSEPFEVPADGHQRGGPQAAEGQ